ncbi:SDR family NAD(P)-dependent oxidoreductase [Gordonia polyisoprenivorans]|uniref:SDR family NAD(P)-dependent oxidoreductase n=1 Tax=Gordonia polyisoprenivorans TaxID=84595 RepID=UPI001AD698F0|nr:SDR family NAD(P)-dependent oxidoreductase [Gordonia polyisoprenivorans]QTI70916.1 SDR family NAD(P)-dependent oxidoreductase [Gordonia polyisoprenivorans]
MESRRWLVSGVSSGLGWELAQTLVEQGHVVIGTVRKDADADRLRTLGPNVHVVQIDLVEPENKVATAVRAAIDEVGGLDVLVNNAGYGLVGAIEESSEDEARHQMETNFWGPWKLIRAALPALRHSDDARILNVSSTAGFHGVPAMGIYNASKFALEGISAALNLELADHGIHVTIVEPGAFRTDWAGGGLKFSESQLSEYADSAAGKMRGGISHLDGRQDGDPRRGAQALVELASADKPPLRFPLGADAVLAWRKHLARTGRELDAWADRSERTSFTR